MVRGGCRLVFGGGAARGLVVENTLAAAATRLGDGAAADVVGALGSFIFNIYDMGSCALVMSCGWHSPDAGNGGAFGQRPGGWVVIRVDGGDGAIATAIGGNMQVQCMVIGSLLRTGWRRVKPHRRLAT